MFVAVTIVERAFFASILLVKNEHAARIRILRDEKMATV